MASIELSEMIESLEEFMGELVAANMAKKTLAANGTDYEYELTEAGKEWADAAVRGLDS